MLTLYKIFSEIIAVTLTNTLIGVAIGRMIVQIIVYADDITLITETEEDNSIKSVNLVSLIKLNSIQVRPHY